MNRTHNSRRALRTAIIVAGAALATSALVATPGASAASPDGYVYAYANPNKNHNHKGASCRWSGKDPDWASKNATGPGAREDCSTMGNNATSLYNRGYPSGNDRVNFYFDPNYGGAWACLGPGDSWGDLSLHIETFNRHGPTLATQRGHGRPLDNDIRSHKWVSYCGQT